ncbi:MAG: hypothetical protein ACOCT0_00070 [Halobacteriota archaeon]
MDTGEMDTEEVVRDLPCDAKLVYVVLEKRGPFSFTELMHETYLSEDETLYAVAVLEEQGLVDSHEHEDEEIYGVDGYRD